MHSSFRNAVDNITIYALLKKEKNPGLKAGIAKMNTKMLYQS